MNVYIVDIEFYNWDNSMIDGVYSTLKKAKQSFTNKYKSFNGKVKLYISPNGLTYYYELEYEDNGYTQKDNVSYSIKKHKVL